MLGERGATGARISSGVAELVEGLELGADYRREKSVLACVGNIRATRVRRKRRTANLSNLKSKLSVPPAEAAEGCFSFLLSSIVHSFKGVGGVAHMYIQIVKEEKTRPQEEPERTIYFLGVDAHLVFYESETRSASVRGRE